MVLFEDKQLKNCLVLGGGGLLFYRTIKKLFEYNKDIKVEDWEGRVVVLNYDPETTIDFILLLLTKYKKQIINFN